MYYLPKKLLNNNPLITAKEQYHLVQVIENFKSRMHDFLEARKGRGEKFESELPAGDEITPDELNNLIGLLSDIESRKRPITRIAYLKALNILQQDIKHLPILKNIFKKKGLTKNVAMPIESILSANTSNHVNDLVNYIRGSEQISASELASMSTPERIENLFPMLHEHLVRSIFSMTVPGGGGKGTGKGELALILLLKDGMHPVKGDVQVPEGLIEVKQGAGDEQSAGRLSGSQNIYGDIKAAFVKNFSDIIGNAPGFRETYWYNLNDKNFKTFTQMLMQAIEADPNRNLREQIVRAYTNSVSIYLKDFNPEAITSTIDGAFDRLGLPLKEQLTVGLFKLCFMYYHSIESFTYFAVYKDGELFFKTYEEALNSIDTPGGLTYAATPNFQDARGNAFMVTF
jgi:hypothetical protein